MRAVLEATLRHLGKTVLGSQTPGSTIREKYYSPGWKWLVFNKSRKKGDREMTWEKSNVRNYQVTGNMEKTVICIFLNSLKLQEWMLCKKKKKGRRDKCLWHFSHNRIFNSKCLPQWQDIIYEIQWKAIWEEDKWICLSCICTLQLSSRKRIMSVSVPTLERRDLEPTTDLWLSFLRVASYWRWHGWKVWGTEILIVESASCGNISSGLER